MEVKNITKAATFKTFLHLSYKNTQLLFLWTVRFNFFMVQTLIDDFLGLHKNMNYAFPLMLFLKSKRYLFLVFLLLTLNIIFLAK